MISNGLILFFIIIEINVENGVRRAFIFAFALIQNSRTINEIDAFLYHIYTMFTSAKLTVDCRESIDKIRTAIRGKELNTNFILQKRTPNERKRDYLFKEFRKVSHQAIDKKALKKCSPFHIYYQKIIHEFKSCIQSDHLAKNEFYCPDLFNILANQLYLAPIWTGMMLKSKDKQNRARLSNNPVENYFGQLKNNILKNDIVSQIFSFYEDLLITIISLVY